MVLKATFILNITPDSYLDIKIGLKAHRLKLEKPRGYVKPSQIFCYAKVDSNDEAEEELDAITKINGINSGTYTTKPIPERFFLPILVSSLITFGTILYAFYSAHLMNLNTFFDNSIVHASIPAAINAGVQFMLKKWPRNHVV
jgi:hypothetical protein